MATMLGFVRGVLSQKVGKNLNLSEVIDWSLKLLNKKEEDIKIDDYDEKKQNFINMMSQIDKSKPVEQVNQWTKEELLSKIDLSDSYFINRGFSSEILTKHMVGRSKSENPNAPSYNRIVVPFFDENKKFVIGAQGRSKFEECSLCKEYHNPQKDCHLFSKWANIPAGFEISRNFYNIWNAKKHIEQTSSVYIVEGAPNVWKLEECGVLNAVALCKSRMSDAQQIKLECMGVTNVYLILDNDDAGRDGDREIKKQIGRQFRVKSLDFPCQYNDISQIKELSKIKEYLCIS
jgi:5S rRNA maturation endonuclease (ribonuclease M5)